MTPVSFGSQGTSGPLMDSNNSYLIKSKSLSENMLEALLKMKFTGSAENVTLNKPQKINSFMRLLDRAASHTGEKKDWSLPSVRKIDSVEIDTKGNLKVTMQVTHTNILFNEDGSFKKNPDGSPALDKAPPQTKKISFTYSDKTDSFKIDDVKPVENNQIVQS
jgi:hypothetical protein